MAIVLLQWVSFAAMPSRTLNPLSVVIACQLGLPLHSWSVIGMSSSLLLVFGLCIIYILHCIIYIYKSLLILFFSRDFVLIFIAKALFLVRLFLRATHNWVILVKNRVVGVTKRGCSTVGEAGYRACSGRPLLVG